MLLTEAAESGNCGVMKISYFALLVFSGMAFAEEAPRGSFKSTQLNEAREAAKAQGKALIYIETDSKSTCPKTEWGTSEAYSALKRDHILVVEDEALGEKPPLEMWTAITASRKIGNTTPCLTIVDPSDLKFITGASYTNISADKSWAKKIGEAVSEAMKPASSETVAPTSATISELRDWTNTEGKTIRASLVEKKADVVSLKLENGKIVEYPIDKLSEASKGNLTSN